jgi:uncharacterized membrane protein
MESSKIEWKSSLVKSIIYRGITILLGITTAYIITRNLAAALSLAPLTELVQGINYFVYELIWSTIARRKLEQRILKNLQIREIDLKIDYSAIEELAYVLSEIDTFVPKIYLSTLNIFNSMLKNEELEEIREKIQTYKDNFQRVHSKRKLFFVEGDNPTPE